MESQKDILQPFDPRAAEYRGKLWVRVVRPESVTYHFYWGRIVLAAFALALVCWLAGASSIWVFVKYVRGYDDVSYLDLALFPARAAHYRDGLGHFYLSRGEQEVEKKNYLDGYTMMRSGLSRVPYDLKARQQVALTEARLGLLHRALRTLMQTEGVVRAAGDLDYLKFSFSLMLQAKEDDKVIELAGKLLPPKPDTVLTHQYVALQAATAHFNRGRYTEAARLLGEWKLLKSVEGAILQAKCDWECGYAQLALVELEADAKRFSKHDELFVELIRMNRELGHLDEARRYALLRYLQTPAKPGPRIDLIQMYRSTGYPADEAREQETFLREFKGDTQALTELACLAVDSRQPVLMERVYALAAAQRLPMNNFNLARVELAFAQRDYRAAQTWAEAALEAKYETEDSLPRLLRALQALAMIGLGDSQNGELQLRALLLGVRLRPADMLIVGRQLKMLGYERIARDFLESAVTVDPRNEAALAQLVRLDAAAGNRAGLQKYLPELLRAAKPPRAVLNETLLRLDQPGDAALRDRILAVLARLPAGSAPRRRRVVRRQVRRTERKGSV